MRITFLIPPVNLSGGVRVVAIYAERLARRGHQVVVVSQRLPAVSAHRRLLARLRGDSLPALRDDHFRGRGIDLRYAAEPGPILARDVPEADVVVATWWETAYMAADLPPEKGTKLHFIQSHEVHDFLPRHITRGVHYLPMTRVTIAEWLVETMAREYGDTDVALVPNSVDTEQFDAPERERQAVPTVGLMYSTASVKGVDVSISAIERARGRVPDLRVVAFGAEPPSDALPLPPGTDFTLRPAQDRIAALYAGCDVYLFGSRNEGFGLPLLEAMACRCPVVATRSGAAPDLVEEGVSGHLVGIDDATALGDRLADVLSLPGTAWKRMSDAAYARAHAYSWDDATARFEGCLAAAVAAAR